MTILVAQNVPGEGSWIGSDRLLVEGNRSDVMIGATAKWVVRGDWAVGCAGLVRVLNLLAEQAGALLDDLTGPAQFRDRLEPLLRAVVAPDQENRYLPDFGTEFLLASPDAVWDFDSNLFYSQIQGFTARGSGAEYARGAVYALGGGGKWSLDLPASSLVVAGLDAAIHNDPNCGGIAWTTCLRVGQA